MTVTIRKPKPPKPALKARRPIAKVNKAKSPAPDDPISKLAAVEARVNSEILGRADLVRGIMLALIAGQNVLALGVPGTAKTMLVQRIAQSFAGEGDVFDILLTKFTKASEVFGPTDIAALERGEYRVNTAGYLASAKVGIIDEVFKGSSAILNALLRIANERTFRNGDRVISTPVRMLVGMSNEFPEDPATLAAFFDRFPAKFVVEYLDTDEFASMIESSWSASFSPMPVKLTDEDFAEIDRRVRAVNFPREMAMVLTSIRADLKGKGIEISDRRWVQAVRLMAASAVYEGRDTITRKDLPVLKAVAWNSEVDRPVFETILPNYLNPFEREVRMITDECYAARAKILEEANYGGDDESRPSPDIARAASAAASAIHTVRGAKGRLEMIEETLEDEDDRELLEQAQQSIESVEKAVMQVIKGRSDGLSSLNDSESDDI